MLLDELLAERERAENPPTTPPPVLTVDPVAVPPAVESGRRAVRQRLVELEQAARRNFLSAEEARRVLANEHQRLQAEATARTHAEHEAAALRREIERLSTKEAQSSSQERARAERAARTEIAGELERFQEEHERVIHEVAELRDSLSEHDGLLEEYVTRLRDEQSARAALRVELEHAEGARSLAERSLQRATENARLFAEDEMIRLATAEQELADASSDRDRLAAQLAELTAGDGPIGRMTAQLEERDAAISRLEVRVADLSGRIDASEEAAGNALAERDDAIAARSAAEERLRDTERARADAEADVDLSATRIRELEAELAERIEATDTRAREMDSTLGKLRRQAREASTARGAAQEELAKVTAERDELLDRVTDLCAESERARADGDQLRAHAVILGDELANTRATVAELQASVSASASACAAAADAGSEPTAEESSDESPQAAAPAPASADETTEVPPPLPLRVAGRHAPAPPLARRRPRRAPQAARAEVESRSEPEVVSEPDAPTSGAPEPDPAAAEPEAPKTEAPKPEAAQPETKTARTGPAGEAFRRTALAEFTALATSSGDDFSPRRR
jgi:chromosome segregation ATPase